MSIQMTEQLLLLNKKEGELRFYNYGDSTVETWNEQQFPSRTADASRAF